MSYEYPLMCELEIDHHTGDYLPYSGFFSVAQNLVYVCVRVVILRFIVLI